MATSISSPPARPMMSAPTPLAGNSTMWASAPPNSPTMTSVACRAAVPGHDPVPLAVAKTLTGQPYWTGHNAVGQGLVIARSHVRLLPGVLARGSFWLPRLGAVIGIGADQRRGGAESGVERRDPGFA